MPTQRRTILPQEKCTSNRAKGDGHFEVFKRVAMVTERTGGSAL